jgi:hypothetical protein
LAQQPEIDKRIQAVNGKILTPLITLDTPGKATVRVIILADPVSYEYTLRYFLVLVVVAKITVFYGG